MGQMGHNGEQEATHIGARYRLVEKLGTGGMSVIWRGYDEILGRQVAVKVLSPRLAGDDSFRGRLRQEASAAARLCHPHITGIFDFGEFPFNEQLTVPYVVMELNVGESVAARLARTGALPWRDAVVITAEVASALATAHACGVVHRDVTPANVMLTAAGAKVVDFGISALIGQRDTAADGSLLGTPAYLAPERLGGGQVSPATDVYALGLLLYRLLTARFPWPAENTTEALRAHLYAAPKPIPAIDGLPPEVAELCLRCLAKGPADRPSAAEIAEVLAALVGLRPIVAPAAVRTPGPPLVRATAPMPRRNVLRLRAGLRVGAALRVGGARPLGGGVFVGGRLARDVLTGGRFGRAVFARRHRLQAALASLTVLLAIGLGWSSAREPTEVGPAQAAAAGTGPVLGVVRGADCKIRYQVRRDTGSDFEALLTVVNTSAHTVGGWRAEFAYPGTQRLTDIPETIAQVGRRVVLRAKTPGALNPGKSVTLTLRGAYRGSNPLPLAFTLNGHSCQSEVIGATTGTSVDAVPLVVIGDAAGAAGGVKESPTIKDPAKRSKAEPRTHQPPKINPKPRSGTPKPGRSPQPLKPGGFSIAA
jgi:serine/threonine-protein kinase